MSSTRYLLPAQRLGQQLHSRRKALQLTQAEVAELASTTQRTVSLLETGNPTGKLNVLVAVADVLGLELILVERDQLRSSPQGPQ